MLLFSLIRVEVDWERSCDGSVMVRENAEVLWRSSVASAAGVWLDLPSTGVMPVVGMAPMRLSVAKEE